MVRTQIYIGEEEKSELEALAKKKKVAVADLIRKGIAAVLEGSRFSAQEKMIDDLYGLWADRDDIKDGISYENDMRKGWRTSKKISEKPLKYGVRKKKSH